MVSKNVDLKQTSIDIDHSLETNIEASLIASGRATQGRKRRKKKREREIYVWYSFSKIIF